MTTLSLSHIGSRILHRSRIAAAKASLNLRQRVKGRTLWIDYGFVQLPFHGDGDQQELYYHLDGKQWWQKEVDLISPYIGAGGVGVDIGANLGFISAILSGLTGPTGAIHSFEPSPVTYDKLQEIIRVNHLANVTTYNFGCGREESSMTLFSPSSSGNATLRPNEEIKEHTRATQTVRIVRLDDFLLPKLERLEFLKIDTEGYEDEVLAGASELIARFKPVIYIELCAQYLESSKRAVSFLLSCGYRFDREVDLSHSANGDNFFAFPAGYRSK